MVLEITPSMRPNEENVSPEYLGQDRAELVLPLNIALEECERPVRPSLCEIL